MPRENKHSKAAMQLSMTYESESFEKYKKRLHSAFLSNTFPKKEISKDLAVRGARVKASWIPTSEVLRIDTGSGRFDVNPLTGKIVGNASAFNRDESFAKDAMNAAIDWLGEKIKEFNLNKKNQWIN